MNVDKVYKKDKLSAEYLGIGTLHIFFVEYFRFLHSCKIGEYLGYESNIKLIAWRFRLMQRPMLKRHSLVVAFAGVGLCGRDLIANAFNCEFIRHYGLNRAFMIAPVFEMVAV